MYSDTMDVGGIGAESRERESYGNWDKDYFALGL